jgi:hypothetical protein
MRLFSLSAALLAGAAAFAAPAFAVDAPTADPAVIALGAVPHGRLTDAVVPSAYRIDTRFDPAKDGFSGETEIEVTLAHPSRYIDLHGRNLTMSAVTATAGGTSYTGHWHEVDPTGVARLVFDEAIPAGKATLAFAYTGKYQGNASGLFHAKVGDDWYGWSQFESIDARAAFPGFDEPGFKVPFTLTIRTPPGQTAVSNAPEVSSTLEDGWQVHRFAPTLPLPTYLVAMMAGPFAVVEGEVPPTPQRATPLPLRIVSTKTNAANLQFALDNSKPIVQHLEAYFGQAFPYPKLDQITSPLMGGAMENAGADLSPTREGGRRIRSHRSGDREFWIRRRPPTIAGGSATSPARILRRWASIRRRAPTRAATRPICSAGRARSGTSPLRATRRSRRRSSGRRLLTSLAMPRRSTRHS